MLIDAYGMRVKYKIIKRMHLPNKIITKLFCSLRVNEIFISKIGVNTADS